MKYCMECGVQLPNEAKFCYHCGKSQRFDLSEETPLTNNNNITYNQCVANAIYNQGIGTTPKPTQKRKRSYPDKKKVLPIIKSSVILFVATLLLVFSFLPVFYIEESYLSVNVEAQFSIFDSTVFMFDSGVYMNQGELQNSSIYQEIELLSSKISLSNYRNFSLKEKRIFNKILINTIRLNLMSEKVNPTYTLIICGIFSIIYYVSSLAFFVLALLNLLATVGAIKKHKVGLEGWTTILLTLQPIMFLFQFYLFFISQCVGISHFAFTGFGIVILVLPILTIIMSCVFRLILSEKKESFKPYISRIIATTLAIVVICLAFSPVMVSKVNTYFSGATAPAVADIYMNASVFDIFNFSGSMQEEIDSLMNLTTEGKIKYFASATASFSSLKLYEAESFSGLTLNITLLSLLLGNKLSTAITTLLSLSSLLFIFAVLFSLIVLWQNLLYFTTGKYTEKLVFVSKLLCGIFAFLGLACAIALVAITYNLATTYMPNHYTIHMAGGVICFAVFAIGAIFCPSKIKSKLTDNTLCTEAIGCPANEEQIISSQEADVPTQTSSDVVENAEQGIDESAPMYQE